jgi:hypothetical protein
MDIVSMELHLKKKMYFKSLIRTISQRRPNTFLHETNFKRGHLCCNPSLGLATKVKACKGAGQEGSPRVTSHTPGSEKECEGMNLHTPKEFPLWELESQWTPESSKGNYRGENPMD